MIFRVNIKIHKPEKVVFVDRDGVLIEDEGYLKDPDDIKPINCSVNSLRILRNRRFAIFLISNQAGLAKGIIREDKFHDIRRRFEEIFDQGGKVFDGTFYCPHHVEGKVSALKKDCRSRKPGTEMIETAMGFLRKVPPLSHIYLIGDKVTDIMAGKTMGFRTIMVLTGYGNNDLEKIQDPFLYPDHIADNFDEAVMLITERI